MKNSTHNWHAGERAIQIRAGVETRSDATASRIVRDFLPVQHRQFYQQLPFLLVGSVDEMNRP